jgi:hypothetical protein
VAGRIADPPVRYQAGGRSFTFGITCSATRSRLSMGPPSYRRTVSDRATIDAEVATFNPFAAAGRPPGG